MSELAKVSQSLRCSHHSLFKAELILSVHAGLRRCIIYNPSILLTNDVIQKLDNFISFKSSEKGHISIIFYVSRYYIVDT